MENIFESVDKKLKKLREVELNNTSDEKMLLDLIDKSPTLLARLKNINQPTELDGFFNTLLNKTGIKNANKQTVILALKKSLDTSSPDNPSFTAPITKKAK